jgi:hypothetical protein
VRLQLCRRPWGFHLVADAVKINESVCPGGGVVETCRVYIAGEVGINRNVMIDLA